MYDVAIIGTGAAGISAALTLQARNKSVLLLGKKDLSKKMSIAEEIRNYPGMGIVSGSELSEGFADHLKQMNIGITDKHVTEISKAGESFRILCGQEIFDACSVIIASGVTTMKAYPGEERLLGKGVSYCATCDGFLYKGKKIAVISTSKDFEDEIDYLSSVASHVYLAVIYQGAKEFKDHVSLISAKDIVIQGDDHVSSLISDGKQIDVDAVFILRDQISPSSLIKGIETDGNHIAVDRMCRTNIAGCFAAGDCTGRPYQYAKAVGEGNVAAHSSLEYLAAHNLKGNAKTRPYKSYPMNFDDALDVTDVSSMPTDEMINELVTFNLTHGEVNYVEKDVVEKGDVVLFDAQGGTGRFDRKGLRLTALQGIYDYEVEKAMLDHRKGDSFTFVKNHTDVKITIRKIEHPVSLEPTDEMVKALHDESVNDLAQYRAKIRKETEDNAIGLISYYVFTELYEQDPDTDTPEEVIERLGKLELDFFDGMFLKEYGKGLYNMNEEELLKNLGVHSIDEFIAGRREWYCIKYNQLLKFSKAMNIELTDRFDYMESYEALMMIQQEGMDRIRKRLVGGENND